MCPPHRLKDFERGFVLHFRSIEDDIGRFIDPSIFRQTRLDSEKQGVFGDSRRMNVLR